MPILVCKVEADQFQFQLQQLRASSYPVSPKCGWLNYTLNSTYGR